MSTLPAAQALSMCCEIFGGTGWGFVKTSSFFYVLCQKQLPFPIFVVNTVPSSMERFLPDQEGKSGGFPAALLFRSSFLLMFSFSYDAYGISDEILHHQVSISQNISMQVNSVWLCFISKRLNFQPLQSVACVTLPLWNGVWDGVWGGPTPQLETSSDAKFILVY